MNANVHRGVHYLSQKATDLHEEAREKVRRFINAGSTSEVIFTRGTTESLNLIVSSFCDEFMQAGDEVIVSVMEHHSNIVPWQLQAARRGISIRVIPMNDRGELDLEEYGKVEQMPALEGKKMFLYLSPKKAGVAKKSQQKMDRERREAEAKNSQKADAANANNDAPKGGGLFDNAKNGADILKKLSGENE